MESGSTPLRCERSAKQTVPCDVLEDQRSREYPDHICGAVARRLTRQFGAQLAPVPDGIDVRWTRRITPDRDIERIAWLRWQWTREWPLTAAGEGETAEQARALGIPWGLVVPGSVPEGHIGVVVTKVAGSGTITLFGHVARSSRITDGGFRAWEHEFVAPTVVWTLPVSSRAGMAVVDKLRDWYRTQIQGLRLPRGGRPRTTSFEDLLGAMQRLVRAYQEQYEDGGTTRHTVRQEDLAAAVGISPRTLRRFLADQGMDFHTFRSQVTAQLASDSVRF